MPTSKLTNGELAKELKDLIERAGSDLPQEISHQILSLLVQDTSRNIGKMRNEFHEALCSTEEKILVELKSLNDKVMEVNIGLDCIKKDREKYPSIPKWASEHKKHAIGLAALFAVVSQLWFISGFRLIVVTGVIRIVGTIFRLPTETLDSVIALLFS